MSTQVVRVQGFTKGSLSNVGREAERENIEHRNRDIDPAQKKFNEIFKQTERGFYGAYHDIRASLNVQGKETKTSIAFEGMVITADKAFFEGLGWESGKPMPSAVKKFFAESYEWAKSEIGYRGTDKNIMSAIVHADETTPHLQLYYLPITDKWQDKVYAKGEDGKVLRSATGSPLQAKDESGKIIYRQVEDENAPKLARSEFWRVRGGQHSYSQMQDRFQERIGSRYGLERGAVGSDKVHRTKNQWEKEQLEAEIKPLRALKASIKPVEDTGTTVLPGVVVIKKKDLESLKEQAKAYAVNRDEIKDLRKRARDVFSRETKAGIRETEVTKHENEIERKNRQMAARQADINEQYERQRDVNHLLEQAEKDRDAYKNQNTSVLRENASLSAELKKSNEKHAETENALRTQIRGVYECLADIVQAAGMLKYDETHGYKVATLSPSQGRVIDALADYGAACAEKDGFKDLAEVMRTRVGIAQDVQKCVKALEPKPNRGLSR